MKHRTALVSLLAVGLLVWFLRHANLADVWRQVQRARVDLLGVAIGVVAATYWARAVRWRYLLSPIGPTRFRTVFRATIIGFAALGLLPARAGDVLRPYLVSRQEGLSLTSTFATIVIERVLDLIAVLALLAVYLAVAVGTATLSPPLLKSLIVSASVAGAAAVVLSGLLWVLASHPERIGGMDGLATLTRMREREFDAEVVIISGHGSVEAAVRAIKMGAFDFVEKPLSLDKTVLVVRNALRQRRLQAENIALRARVDAQHTMVGESHAMPMLALRKSTAISTQPTTASVTPCLAVKSIVPATSAAARESCSLNRRQPPNRK